MAFRIRAEESVAEGLQRLAKKNVRVALDELGGSPPSDEAIHEARKSLKKARAILETIQADNGRLDRDEKQLRKVNHILSPLRDADAMRQIFAELRNRNPRLFSEHTFARLRRQLTSHRRDLLESASRDGAWEKACRSLRSLRRSAKRWRPSHRQFGALAPGLRIAHKNGRKTMARALKRQGAADFHEWRKAIKALWYELRLIEPCGTRIRRQVAALGRAETWLGDDHNLVVLCAELSKQASSCGATVDFDRVRLAADRYQCALRNKTIASVRSLFERKSNAYVREIKRAWQARRNREKTGRTRRSRGTAAA
jgi:CHAD domain-containing protein